MAPKTSPQPEPPAPLTRAEKIARSKARRAARVRHFDLDNHPPAGPAGGYTIVNAPNVNNAEITDAQT